MNGDEEEATAAAGVSVLTWPLATLDFEASGLTAGFYPIEIGLCVWREPTAPLQVWSTLIRPATNWRKSGDQSQGAHAVHGIGWESVIRGVSPTQAVRLANACLPGMDVAWCDGGAWDVHWARTLARASGVRLAFGIGQVDMMTAAWPEAPARRMAAFLDRTEAVHRAGPDAERLMRAFAYAADLAVGPAMQPKPQVHRG